MDYTFLQARQMIRQSIDTIYLKIKIRQQIQLRCNKQCEQDMLSQQIIRDVIAICEDANLNNGCITIMIWEDDNNRVGVELICHDTTGYRSHESMRRFITSARCYDLWRIINVRKIDWNKDEKGCPMTYMQTSKPHGTRIIWFNGTPVVYQSQ